MARPEDIDFSELPDEAPFMVKRRVVEVDSALVSSSITDPELKERWDRYHKIVPAEVVSDETHIVDSPEPRRLSGLRPLIIPTPGEMIDNIHDPEWKASWKRVLGIVDGEVVGEDYETEEGR